jgi:glycosyltransferase involved in cell wall biosynthesis
MRLTIIARADLTGLGIQSRNWVRLLDPDKVVVINSRPFNHNDQHLEWYTARRNAFVVDGFIKDEQINPILNNTDVLLTFESTYNYKLLSVARARGIKTILQNNWEFTDYLVNPILPFPDLLVNHSYWHLDDQKNLWPEITGYCPTPIFIEDFQEVYQQNLDKIGKVRFLHIAGRKTYEDRNGTQDLLEAIKLIPIECDFELVIKTQTIKVDTSDPRIIVDSSQPTDEKELYRNFDAVVMPRRYAGACLPMNESLASGLPVIMTDIDPNNKILPYDWLVESKKKTSFITRGLIDVYSADHQKLADKIIQFATLNSGQLHANKIIAKKIAIKEYSSESVRQRWTLLLQKLGL